MAWTAGRWPTRLIAALAQGAASLKESGHSALVIMVWDNQYKSKIRDGFRILLPTTKNGVNIHYESQQ
jgi:hypothetical protein